TATPTTEIYTLSLHDALPILEKVTQPAENQTTLEEESNTPIDPQSLHKAWSEFALKKKEEGRDQLFMLMNQPYEYKDGTILLSRSEEHTSELQSRENLVCRLL